MFEEEFVKLSSQDQNEFARIVNALMLKSFVVRESFDSREKMMKINPEYRFIERYYEIFEEYLKYSGWHLEKDVTNGVIAIYNEYEQNRLRIDRETSLILFTLRLIYETKKAESNAPGESLYMTTPELLKTMIEYGITMQGKRLTGRLLGRSLRFMAAHNIICKVSGSYDEGNVTFYILPSITFAVDSQKIAAMSDALERLKEGETL
ncbi:putative uncharacterized protein [Coprobacillus sp. CAG:826]|nr:DUF4194 domain-containing protein [Coprobacillus sp.]CDD92069.1 putative uncharacterized protein [Coprobacillus sp. CAG:826]